MWLLATVLGNADLGDVFLSGKLCVGRTELWVWNLTAQGQILVLPSSGVSLDNSPYPSESQ